VEEGHSLDGDDALPLAFALLLDLDVGAGRRPDGVDVAAPAPDHPADGVQRHGHFLRPERRV